MVDGQRQYCELCGNTVVGSHNYRLGVQRCGRRPQQLGLDRFVGALMSAIAQADPDTFPLVRIPYPGGSQNEETSLMSFKAALFASPIVLLADFALLGGAANAEATFQPNSDILGVKLSMTADEAIKYLKANFITSEVTIDKPRPVTLTSPGQAPIAIPTDIIIGYEITVTPKAEQAANAVETADLNKRVAAGRAAGFGQLVRPNPESADLVRLNVNPGNPQEILAIKRTRVYRPEDQPLKTVFMEAVEQKYGKPVLSGREGFDADAPAASGCSWSA
jgi:hypothetical protein